MPKYSYVIDTPDGPQRVDLDGPVPDAAAMEYALGPPQPRPNPAPTPGYPAASLEQALNPDYGAMATQLRVGAPLVGGMAGPAGAGLAMAGVEPLARMLEGQSALPPWEEIAGRLPSYEQLQTPEGQAQLVDSMMQSFPGSMESGVVMKNSKRALPFTSAPWEGVEGTKTLPLRRPHAYLPADLVPEHLANSAARDEHGNLIRVYHGTRGLDDTKALDPDFLGEPWFGESGGLYTTEQPSITTGYNVRERATNFEKQLADVGKRATKDERGQFADLKHTARKLTKEGVTPETAPTTYDTLNRELQKARTSSVIGPNELPGISRSDVVARRPQTRAVYLDIRQPFHVEKSMPREQALQYLDQMMPQNIHDARSQHANEILDEVGSILTDNYTETSPEKLIQHIKDSWEGSSYAESAQAIADAMAHPQVNLALQRYKKYTSDYNYETGHAMDLMDQFKAAVKAYLPPSTTDRNLVIPELLRKELLGSDAANRKEITGGEVLRVLKNNGVDTRAALSAAGYDGITHIGGGPPAHRVWIAFKPDQIYDAIPVEAYAEQAMKARQAGLPPTQLPPIAPHSVIGGPLWNQPLPPKKGQP